MSIKDFEILSVLGKGAYGCVYKVRRYADDKFYAMKKILLNKLEYKEKEGCLNEVRFLASITNNNIISYKEAFIDNESNTLHIIMEYADDGDLENHILENKKNGRLFPEEKIWSILIGIVNGLKSLHDRKIMHRDLKSANIFLFKDGSVKIGDMNVSKIYRVGIANTQTGTPYYASPEVWKDQPYDYKCDIWSLGCVIYEMCTNKVPFVGESIQHVFTKVCKGVYEPISLMYSSDLKDFINLLLQVNPHNRPYIDKVIYLLQRKENKSIYTNKLENLSILKTIRVPRNINELVLPKPKYRDTHSAGVKKENYIDIKNIERFKLYGRINSKESLLYKINNYKRIPINDNISIENSIIQNTDSSKKRNGSLNNSIDRIIKNRNNSANSLNDPTKKKLKLPPICRYNIIQVKQKMNQIPLNPINSINYIMPANNISQIPINQLLRKKNA